MEPTIAMPTEDIKSNSLYIDTNNTDAMSTFSEAFCKLISDSEIKYTEIVIVCVGTDRATGDSLGPLTGSKLETLSPLQDIKLYGTLDEPVHAKNLEKTIEKIKTIHKDSLVIAIDASLGKTCHIGYIKIGEGCIRPGAGLNKNLPPIGDFYITGIVNFSGMMEAIVLQTTKLSLVMKMANIISLGIYHGLNKLTEI